MPYLTATITITTTLLALLVGANPIPEPTPPPLALDCTTTYTTVLSAFPTANIDGTSTVFPTTITHTSQVDCGGCDALSVVTEVHDAQNEPGWYPPTTTITSTVPLHTTTVICLTEPVPPGKAIPGVPIPRGVLRDKKEQREKERKRETLCTITQTFPRCSSSSSSSSSSTAPGARSTAAKPPGPSVKLITLPAAFPPPPAHGAATATARCATTIASTVCRPPPSSVPRAAATAAAAAGAAAAATLAPLGGKKRQKRQDYCTSTFYTSPAPPAGPTTTVWQATEHKRETLDCGGCKFLLVTASPGLADPVAATPSGHDSTVTREGTTTLTDYRCLVVQGAGCDIPVQGPEIMAVGAAAGGGGGGGEGAKIKLRTAVDASGTTGLTRTGEEEKGSATIDTLVMDEYVNGEGLTIITRTEEPTVGATVTRIEEAEYVNGEGLTIITRTVSYPSFTPHVPPMPTRRPAVSKVAMHVL